MAVNKWDMPSPAIRRPRGREIQQFSAFPNKVASLERPNLLAMTSSRCKRQFGVTLSTAADFAS